MKVKRFIPILVTGIIFASCASTKVDYNVLNQSFKNGDYEICEKAIEKQIDKKNPEINLQFDMAMLQHYSGNYENSSKTFNYANARMDEAYTKSVTRAVGAAALNENASEYSGNLYEYILVNAFNSLNYHNMGNLDEALVEIRKIEIKQKEYISKYGELVLEDAENEDDDEDVSKSAKTMNVDMNSVYKHTPRKPTENDLYKDSAFAHYLATLLYLKDESGSPDLHAREYEALNRGVECASLKDDLSIPRGMGRLDFIALTGQIVSRKEGVIYIPDFEAGSPYIYVTIGNVTIPAFRLKYVYPYVEMDASENIIRGPETINAVKITLADGRETNLSLVEWLDEACKKDVALRARRDFKRSIARSTTKKAAAVALAAVSIGRTSGVLRGVAEIAASEALDAVDAAETADVRQAKYLPSVVSGGGFTLEPSIYSGKIEFFNTKNELVSTKTFENVRVDAGKPTIVETVCVK